VRPGELVVVDDDGLHARQVLQPEPTPCAFEWIYFARGDGVLDGADVHAARVRMGEILAHEAPAEADVVVVGVPESGLAAALGYARASGIPFDLGLHKSPYAGRSFIAPNARLRDQKVRLKLAPTGDGGRAPGGAGRRLDRARHHLGAHRAAAARRGRQRGPLPGVQPADPLPLLLRDRHGRAPGAGGGDDDEEEIRAADRRGLAGLHLRGRPRARSTSVAPAWRASTAATRPGTRATTTARKGSTSRSSCSGRRGMRSAWCRRNRA
jgi:hypothetical protein